MTSMQVVNPNQNVLEKEFLFIIGSPRSDTTWLQLMLGAHPQVCATTELRLYNKYTAPWLKPASRNRSACLAKQTAACLGIITSEAVLSAVGTRVAG